MKGTIDVSREAEKDILGCILYLARENPNLPKRFLAAFEETCKHLLDMPHMGREKTSEYATLLSVREFPMLRFTKYLVFYRENQENLEVVRVLHGARDLPAIFAEDPEEA